ncbi:ABC-2 type transporter-domain-containing protein [Podospora appendiculata]|uniref:ABC-2 type transporter-domain-containing protein n=1 Tax=Podospora appendiculata TaxID=314037 RepID=A0AAE0XGK9_9PEZI|nr:ABC-2 type transporter-domain-containing protein [Podospora appendiculata]
MHTATKMDAEPTHAVSTTRSSFDYDVDDDDSDRDRLGPTGDDTTHNGTSATADSQQPTETRPSLDGGHHGLGLSMIDEADTSELQRIATALSHRRKRRHARNNEDEDEGGDDNDDPALDPSSEAFDLTKWLQDFVSQLTDKGINASHTGVAFRDLDVFGSGAELQLQHTVHTMLLAPFRPDNLRAVFWPRRTQTKKTKKHILHGFNGLLRSGEILAVLGRPGSGCTTLLKAMCGELHGLQLADTSVVHYNGIPQRKMLREFGGEVIYNQEVDKHFPHLTVGQTIEFAASVRTPSVRIQDMSRAEYCRYIARVFMAVFGLSHVYNTKVGNDFIRGVSGGERKRVSIAEMMVAGSPLCAWDNSTRGLDSASALRFAQALRLSSKIGTHAHAVAMYQASQAIYDLFDKTTVLYEGRQIYFGPADRAQAFFERQGWLCPPRQTTGDFLTSITNPMERVAQPGMADRVPRTPDDFEQRWRASAEFAALRAEMDAYDAEFRPGGHTKGSMKDNPVLATLRAAKQTKQARHVRPKSPYMISIGMQVWFNTRRAYQRIWNNISATATNTLANLVLALIIGSIFYGNDADATSSFAAKGAMLFMAILLNTLAAISEIASLYAQRPIVEKHASYAFYHPATEAAAGIVADIPVKFVIAVVFNLLVYFMAGLRRAPAQFFVFFLVSYISTFVMSAVFRTLAALTKTVSQAMALAGVMILALIIYTGYVIAVPQMHPWFSWIRWINPIYYAFEILVANEFHGRDFACSAVVPPYSPAVGASWICAVSGAVAGRATVSGDAFIETTYGYSYDHVWRNFGILLGFLFFFMAVYFAAVELNSSVTSTAEALVFQHGRVPSHLRHLRRGSKTKADDEELVAVKGGAAPAGAGNDNEPTTAGAIEPQRDLFTWQNVVYDIHVKGGQRRLLDHVSGWVKPGTLTALMGASGAGKTTLLDTLAQRTSIGVVTGDMFVNGRPFGADFQRETGYVQQQDLHLDTATVRESLQFSAMLRRPKSVSAREKNEFVEEVIRMLGMQAYADAVVGIPGEGLNVEQRKLLTIGVELVAKPKLLLFLDEPTSGLDSQSAWAICVFLRKLADAGQAVLCTIHQPNAMLFQQFDRLLFLAAGGQTVYFGDVGKNSRTLLDYFEANGARPCDAMENPAEYMLELVAEGATNSNNGRDWPSVWKASDECKAVTAEIAQICSSSSSSSRSAGKDDEAGTGSNNDGSGSGPGSEFAMPLTSQIWVVTHRIFQQYWRMPAYVIAKVVLGMASGLFIGFTFFHAESTQAGMRDVLYAVFMVTTIFTTLVQQIQPLFVTQRALYEVRERPSKAYSWKAFLFANIVVELPYQVLTGIVTFASFYYPVVSVQSADRQGLVLLFTIQLFVYASAFAHMSIVVMPDAESAGALVILLTMMTTIFSGVLQPRTMLPAFWSFMYRVSPFTYWIAGIVATVLHERPVECSATETLVFDPPPGMTCRQYLAPMLTAAAEAAGTLQNPDDTAACRYCTLSVADQFLATVDIVWAERWRNWGIIWAFVVFDIAMAVLLYYVFRVRKWSWREWRAKRKEKVV